MQASDNHFPKVILEERLADGSDTGLPDADHRALFMGEDGVLYEKSPAGVVSPLSGAGGGYTPGGTDVAVADGGTGASSAGTARTNLGLAIGTNVAAQTHASQHEAGGSDEIDVTGLVGAGGGGGGSLYPLDDITLHGTYGDHFDVPALDAIWTRRLLPNPSEIIADSWLNIVPNELASAGYLQSWTPTTEAEFQAAVSTWIQSDDGLGIAILNSSGTGLWLGWQDTIQGLFPVTTYTVSGSAAQAYNITTLSSRAYFGNGRKVWLSLIKKSGLYAFRFSFDGATWVHSLTFHAPSSFTPSQVGILSGNAAGGTNLRAQRVDWFNVVNEKSIGNNLMITPTSGTVTPTVSGTAFTGAAADVIDGDTATAEWIVQAGATPIWFNAAFSVAQTMNRLRMYGYDHDWGMGYVEFSSGTKIPFYSNNGDMKNLFLDFPDETTTFVKVWCHQVGIGSFAGWREIEAYLAS